MNDNLSLKCAFAFLALAAVPARAETINWYSSPKTNLTSSEQNMDSGFSFQLGVFSSGFVPTAGNIAEWSSNWVPAQSTPYSAGTKVFDSNFSVTDNVAPFTFGAKAYIWARSTTSTHDEWILFRKSAWTWPAPNQLNPYGLQWSTAEADEVLIGAINPAGKPLLMQSEAVSSYVQWKKANLATELLDSPLDDPDHDQSSNLMEFVFGTSPVKAGAATPIPPSFVQVSDKNYLQLSVPRVRNRLATVAVEVSSDLVTWNSGAAFTTVVSDSGNMLVVRDKTPSDPAMPRRFMRVKAVATP